MLRGVLAISTAIFVGLSISLAMVVAFPGKLGVAHRVDHRAVWHEQVMTGGPMIYWACLNGDRVYAFQEKADRGRVGLWPGARIAVAAGMCR